MNRTDVAYLVNSCPKYFYILPLHFALIRRYAPSLAWPLFLATEVPDHPVVVQVARDFNVTVIQLPATEAGFLDSRRAATAALPASIKYVFPMQEDFLLDRPPSPQAIEESLAMLDGDPSIIQIRYMPCPGPADTDTCIGDPWYNLNPENNTYMYCFQATMWRREDFQTWYNVLTGHRDQTLKGRVMTEADKIRYEVRVNLAENAEGQQLFRRTFPQPRKHISHKRAHKARNAVFMSPWPYRPTAIVGGVLQPWAKEMGDREGYPI
jgi:hypothetical protein